MILRFLCLLISFWVFTKCTAQDLVLQSHKIKLKSGLKFDLNIPKGYRISVAAEGINRPRFFAKSPDGRLFITDMFDRSDNKLGRVLILENWDENKKQFQKTTTYLDSLHNPNQVSFYSDGKQNYVYVAETGKLSFYKYNSGDNFPSSAQTIIARFPDYGLDYKYGGWHLTRSLAFHNQKLYVSIGSSCNACIEKEDLRACIIEMDPDGSNQKIFARGLRNSVGIKWVNDDLWATGMGRDLIGPEKPEDLFHLVKPGSFHGWPFYFQYRKIIYTDTSFRDSARMPYVRRPPVAPWAFKAHSAPLGFEFFQGFSDSLFNNSFMVALHGSTSVWRQRGNSIVQLMVTGEYREVVTGFLQGKTENKRFGRPCDIIQWNAIHFLSVMIRMEWFIICGRREGEMNNE